ncbi:MAG: ArsB/NhaD family transporter [Alphaproteobacteria bacterium]|nr:ArsB/NhaD family transporter [Alphaproteobacteria bacterium]
MDPKILAALILFITYAILFSEMINRAIVAMLGACIMILCGILTQNAAITGIDFNTIFLLIGMMIIAGISEKSGLFEYIAVCCVKKVKANPRLLMIVLGCLTALLSALLDNVTTVLLIVPITFQITKQLKITPYPYLLLEIFTSNIGGTATLIGDPPNILIGSALNLSFMDFVKELTPIVIVVLFTTIIIFDLYWHNKLHASDKDCQSIMRLDAKKSIKDGRLSILSIIILFTVISGFIIAEHLHLENGTVALFGAAILLLIYSFMHTPQEREHKISEAFNLVDWTTIFFFAGLFIIVHGLETTGLLKIVGNKLSDFSQGSINKMSMLILWFSALLSSAIDNIPFVATMIPMLKSVEESLGGREAMMPVWWALSLGSCFGGNGSLIAASANVIVAGIAARENHPIKFGRFLFWSIPITLISIVISSIFLYIRYF